MASSGRMRRVAGIMGLLGALALPSAAQAAIPNIPNGAGGNITCTVQTGANAGQRHCSGIFTTFDGAPIDINVGFPPAPASGPDGDFPIVGDLPRLGRLEARASPRGGWIDDGYAVFSMSDRGWGNSCGGTDPKRTQPVCAERLQPPDGHALRGARRAGDLRGARRPRGRPARPAARA